jgi:hypothetical protein
MGTVAPYSRDVPTKKWMPPDEATAAHLQKLKDLHEETKALLAQLDSKMDLIKIGVTEIGDKAGIAAPVNALAEFFGVQRKTIYRWMGQEMS